MRKSQGSDYGSIYRGHPGQWSWVLHRITGVGIILFLFAHVIDTAVVGWGPEAYNRVISVYENPFVRLLELGLVAVVLFPRDQRGADPHHRFLAEGSTKYISQLFYGATDDLRRLDDPDHFHHGPPDSPSPTNLMATTTELRSRPERHTG